MSPDLIKLYAECFLLTVWLEWAAVWVWGLRGRREYLLVFAANILTNPAAEWTNLRLFYSNLPLLSGTDGKPLRHLLIELTVFAIEGLWYKRTCRKIGHPWLFSAAVNLTSYVIGGIIGRIL